MAQSQVRKANWKEKIGGWTVLILFLFVGLWVKEWLDSAGKLPHEEETLIRASDNWFIGESRDCISIPTEPRGYAFSRIDCGAQGQAARYRRMKIRFWGRKGQPENAIIYWNCLRKEDRFTCRETSAFRKPRTLDLHDSDNGPFVSGANAQKRPKDQAETKPANKSPEKCF
jgi:hypothetical protein